MAFTGIDSERLRARWVSSAEAPEFVHEIKDFVATLQRIGPSPLNKKVHSEAEEAMKVA